MDSVIIPLTSLKKQHIFMEQAIILWVDDEIESLKSQTIFLSNKGYTIETCTNGYDAIEYVKQHPVDVVLLDESMPGISGIETLSRIKATNNQLPVVMITKNETENLMNEAIGSQISDYLIKPVNPNQVLLSLKKIIDKKSLVAEKTVVAYQQQFRELFNALSNHPNHQEWTEIYKKLIFWELEMEKSESNEMQEILKDQKSEANRAFCKFITKEYLSWVNHKSTDIPLLSHHLFKEKILPHIDKTVPVIWILVDNLRFDQWKAIQPIFQDNFRVIEEDTCYSILPTATQYCRNAVFAGLMPADIEKQSPQYWKNDEEEGGKNLHEEELFRLQLKRLQRDDIRFSYQKIINNQEAQKLVDNSHNLLQQHLSIVVYNFVDMLSHARTEMEVLKELASDEASYRSLTQSWFYHSPLHQALKKLTDKKFILLLTTDHGSIRVQTPVKVIGDKQTTPNLRYKHGRNLNYDAKDVFAVRDPKEAGLPAPGMNSSYIFAKDDSFLCYPSNYNYFVNYYRNTFQHGGISLEEMILPVIRMQPK